LLYAKRLSSRELLLSQQLGTFVKEIEMSHGIEIVKELQVGELRRIRRETEKQQMLNP